MLTIPNPIFPDRNVNLRDYYHLKDDELLITKIFFTVQGEGPFAGHRALFIRLAGCNLGGKGVNGPGCSFCDTDFRFDQGRVWSVQDLHREIERQFPHDWPKTRLVVVTGGEPSLQRRGLINLLYGAPDDVRVQIETNGTRNIALGSIPAYIVCSPKVIEATDGNPKYYRPQEQTLRDADCLKFIVSSDHQSPYHEVPEYAKSFGKPVYVSPMAVYKPGVTSPNKAVVSIWDEDVFDQKKCARNHAYAAELAMKHGYIMSVQMHLFGQVE